MRLSQFFLLFVAVRDTPARIANYACFEVMTGREVSIPEHLFWELSHVQNRGKENDWNVTDQVMLLSCIVLEHSLHGKWVVA